MIHTYKFKGLWYAETHEGRYVYSVLADTEAEAVARLKRFMKERTDGVGRRT